MIHSVKIEPVLNGYVVQVGCQKVAFNSLKDMLEHLQAYLLDPEAIEKVFVEKGINSKHLCCFGKGTLVGYAGDLARELARDVPTPPPQPPEEVAG